MNQVLSFKNAWGVFTLKNTAFLRGSGTLWNGVITHQETFWKSGFPVWSFLKEGPKRTLAEVKYSNKATVICDFMFPYATISKISDTLKKRLFFCAFWDCCHSCSFHKNSSWVFLELKGMNRINLQFCRRKKWMTIHFPSEMIFSLSRSRTDWLARPVPQLWSGWALLHLLPERGPRPPEGCQSLAPPVLCLPTDQMSTTRRAAPSKEAHIYRERELQKYLGGVYGDLELFDLLSQQVFLGT